MVFKRCHGAAAPAADDFGEGSPIPGRSMRGQVRAPVFAEPGDRGHDHRSRRPKSEGCTVYGKTVIMGPLSSGPVSRTEHTFWTSKKGDAEFQINSSQVPMTNLVCSARSISNGLRVSNTQTEAGVRDLDSFEGIRDDLVGDDDVLTGESLADQVVVRILEKSADNTGRRSRLEPLQAHIPRPWPTYSLPRDSRRSWHRAVRRTTLGVAEPRK